MIISIDRDESNRGMIGTVQLLMEVTGSGFSSCLNCYNDLIVSGADGMALESKRHVSKPKVESIALTFGLSVRILEFGTIEKAA